MIRDWETIQNEARPKVRYWLPGAAVDDADLEQELTAIAARGFGGVEIVGLLGTPDEIINGEDGWGGERWKQVLALIDRTCAKLGMSMDVANGPMWPISMPTVTGADDPAALTELTYGVLDAGAAGGYAGALPARRVTHEEGTPVLVHVLAYQQAADGSLVLDSYRDLRSCLSGEEPEQMRLTVSLPQAADGCTWLIFAFYRQPAAQKTGAGKYYVIDHLGRAGAEACRAYWEPLLAEQPLPSMESFFCDSLEYAVSLDWTPDFLEEFEERAGYSILPYLPMVGEKGTYPESDAPGYRADRAEISEMVNQDYLEVVTQCYCENHLAVLEEMAESFGKTIRYQVAYNKPFDEERCGLYVAIPENEGLGRPSLDGLKTMSASAKLGRKRRYSFECAAEFGNSYGQDAEDLLWWVKRSLMSGMNAQVLHGAAYSGGYRGAYSEDGFMKGVVWPGYEAFGRVVSNYWNRTLSAEDTRGCLDAIARMNTLSQKTAKSDCLIYRSSYLNDGCDSEFAFFPDGGRLANAGYSYETASAALLAHPNCRVGADAAGRTVLDPEGAAWQCLLVPPQEAASSALLSAVQRMLEDGLPVIWLGEKPGRAQYYSEWQTEEDREQWAAQMEAVWENPALVHGAGVEDAAGILAEQGIRPRAAVESPMDLITALHENAESGVRYYYLYGYNRVEFAPEAAGDHEEMSVSAVYRKGTTKSTYRRPGAGSRHNVCVSLEGTGAVSLLDPWSGTGRPLAFAEADGRMEGTVSLEEDELLILAVDPGAKACAGCCGEPREIPLHFESLSFVPFGPDSAEEKSFLRSGFGEVTKTIALDGGPEVLAPWRELDPELAYFAGYGVYNAEFELAEPAEGAAYVLSLGEVCDTVRVRVNGMEAPFPDQVMNRVDLTGLVRGGRNTLEIRVTSNLYNQLLHDYVVPGLGFPMPYHPKNYGIYEAEGKKIHLQAFGR